MAIFPETGIFRGKIREFFIDSFFNCVHRLQKAGNVRIPKIINIVAFLLKIDGWKILHIISKESLNKIEYNEYNGTILRLKIASRL